MTLQDVKNTSQYVIGRENILLSNLWLVFFLTCYTVFYNLAQGQARCNIYFNVTVQIGKEMTLEKGENLTIPNVKYCKD